MTSGYSASIVFKCYNKSCIANAGDSDSRSIIVKCNKNNKNSVEITHASHEDKPSLRK